MLHAGGLADMTKLKAAFRNFVKAPQKNDKVEMVKFVCCNFTPYSIRICFLQVNVNSIPKRHATIWLKDIFVLFSGSKSE